LIKFGEYFSYTLVVEQSFLPQACFGAKQRLYG